MLRIMRKQASNWLIKILLGAIVVVFIFWGVGSFSKKGGRVALVNGDQITVDEYKNAYNNLIEQLRQRFKNNLDEGMIEALQLEQQALNQLVNNRLLVQEARRLKFKISDKELADAIMSLGAFQRDGLFDNRLYTSVLSRNRMSPEEFEIAQRESMLVNKLRSFITSGVKVSDREAMEQFNWANASVNIDYVLFDPGNYKGIEPSNEKIKEYFENHKANYKTDVLVKVSYLRFDPNTYKPKVEIITDEEIEDYFFENQEEFKKPKTVEARHILLKVDQGADSETVEKTKKRALEILDMAKKGKDFAELAKQYSEGPTGDQGGYLGTFKKEAMVKPFADKAFSIQAGEISEPVRTQFGWHIIKVENVNETSILSLDEAKKDIQNKLTDARAKNLALDEAEAVADMSIDGEDMLNVAKERNLKVMTTDFFTRQGPEKGISNRGTFASAAFNLEVTEISDVQDLLDGYYILQVIEKIPEKIPEFADVKERIKSDVIKETQESKASKDANALLSALDSVKSMSMESKKYNLSPISTGFFKRNDSIPEIGYEPEISKSAFKLTNEKKFPEEVMEGRKGFYVIEFKGRKGQELEEFNKQKAGIMQSLLVQKQSRAFDAFLAQIKSRSEISIMEEYLK